MWVVEDESGGFKSNIVLSEVLPVLVLVPFKSHCYSPLKSMRIDRQCQYKCMYKINRLPTRAGRLGDANQEIGVPGRDHLYSFWTFG